MHGGIISFDKTTKQLMPSLGSGLSHEPTPLSVFVQDLFKPTIWLEEDVPVRSPGTSSDEGTSVPIPGTPPGENGPTPTLDANPGASARPITPSPGPEGGVAAVTGPPSPETNWRKLIAKYHQLGQYQMTKPKPDAHAQGQRVPNL
jgi:hypothetical protein